MLHSRCAFRAQGRKSPPHCLCDVWVWGCCRHPDVVKLLLERGADKAILDSGDATAAELALARGHVQVAAVLGADVPV